MDDPIMKMAEEVVDGYKGVNPDVRQAMIKETASVIVRQINAEFIARLDDKQVEGFSQLLDTQPDSQQIVKYIQDCGVDVNDAVTTALSSFKSTYYGAKF